MGKEYGLREYGAMMADGVRMAAYRAALERAVRPGSVVVDLGAGIGIMSLISCQLGARRVYAIEPNDNIEIARELAAANGFGDRIQIIQKSSDRVNLPELADVLVSDLRGILPLYARHIPALADARQRFLRPDGVLIPETDDLYVTVVSTATGYGDSRRPWRDGAPGLDMSRAERVTVNQLARIKLAPSDVVTPPRRWASIDYRSVTSASVRGEVTWTVERAAVGHGLRIWFDTTLGPGIGFGNGPADPETVYGSVFLPWSDPVALSPGDDLVVSLSADLVGRDYVWRWETTARDGGRAVKARLRQSSFAGEPLGAASLRRRHPERPTKISNDGKIVAFVLAEMERERVLGDIARDLCARFPEAFSDEAAALAEAAGIAYRYGA